MLGFPKVLVCDAEASGPQPSLTKEASGHSQRGFSVYYCVLVCVQFVTLCYFLPGTRVMGCYVYKHECLSLWRSECPLLNVQ